MTKTKKMMSIRRKRRKKPLKKNSWILSSDTNLTKTIFTQRKNG